jgi:hypothetical protein
VKWTFFFAQDDAPPVRGRVALLKCWRMRVRMCARAWASACMHAPVRGGAHGSPHRHPSAAYPRLPLLRSGRSSKSRTHYASRVQCKLKLRLPLCKRCATAPSAASWHTRHTQGWHMQVSAESSTSGITQVLCCKCYKRDEGTPGLQDFEMHHGFRHGRKRRCNAPAAGTRPAATLTEQAEAAYAFEGT